MRIVVFRWGLAAVYVALVFALLLFFPVWTWAPLLVGWAVYLGWSYLSQERFFSQFHKVRPLTPWDVPDYAAFRERYRIACAELGLTREPYLVVEQEEDPQAWAVGGRRGMVGLTEGLLRLHPMEEVLAIVGHELKHVASRDSLPGLVGGSWLGVLGLVSAYVHEAGESTPGLLAGLLKLVALVLDLLIWITAWVAEAVLARRSRFEEHMADLAGARITSAPVMASALERLEQWARDRHVLRPRYPRWSAAWLADKLHASHPPTPDRVRFLLAAAERGEVGA